MQRVESKAYDAVVIGARCAGASTALLLARAGRRVLCVDRSPPGTDTLSTHALMRAGVLQLERWGLRPELEALGTPRITSSTFHYGNEQVEILIRSKFGVDALFAPRRKRLDALLVSGAERAGVEVRHRTSLVDLVRSRAGRIEGAYLRSSAGSIERVESSLVIGADGSSSMVAKLVGAPLLAATEHQSSTIYGYFAGLENTGYHWCFGEGVSGGTIPTDDGQTNVFVSFSPERFRGISRSNLEVLFKNILSSSLPRLRRLVEHARPVGPLRAFGGCLGYLKQCTGPGWALVGDAGYLKDPSTSHGISDALRDAELLARAILRDPAELESYQTERNALARTFLKVSDQVASYDWSYAELNELHRTMSHEMNREAELIAGWDDEPSQTAVRSPLRRAPREALASGP